MNRHARITERVDKKNEILHFGDFTTSATIKLIKEYERLYRTSIRKALGKLDADDNCDFMFKINEFQNKLIKNKQTAGITLNLSTYNRTFDTIWNTEFSQFLVDKHIARF